MRAVPCAGLSDQARCAERMLRACCLCERRCGVDRTRGEVGACGVGRDSTAYLEDLLWGEERFVTPSYALFFSGCNLRCVFCYAAEQNRRPHAGRPVDPGAVAARVRAQPERPASFSFIGGEPTCHLPTALRIAAELPPELPVVWNSNFLFTPESAELLAGAATVFIADLHFGNDACARELAGVESYFRAVARNLRWAREQGTLVVRLLVLPGHLQCCLAPALAWLAAELPDIPVHLLTNYLPPSSRLITGSEIPPRELMGYLDAAEVAQAQLLVAQSGLKQVA